jgi:YegS/Rv2252/BmrU family lipid kinase
VAAAVTAELNRLGLEYTLHVTERPRHAEDIARQAAQNKEELLLCVGGDGTVSEAAAGLCGSSTALGIIPSGTGDDFARYLGVPKSPEQALETALYGGEREVDVGFANSRAFVNAAGSGFDVAVLGHTERYKKVCHSMPAYVLGVLRTVFSYPSTEAEICIDGKVLRQKCLMLSVANGRFIGGGMKVAPEADASDGLFDVQYIDDLPRWRIPFLLAAFVSGKHLRFPFVHSCRSETLTVTFGDASLQLDGEVFTEKTVRYTIKRAALRVRAPGSRSRNTIEQGEAYALQK